MISNITDVSYIDNGVEMYPSVEETCYSEGSLQKIVFRDSTSTYEGVSSLVSIDREGLKKVYVSNGYFPTSKVVGEDSVHKYYVPYPYLLDNIAFPPSVTSQGAGDLEGDTSNLNMGSIKDSDILLKGLYPLAPEDIEIYFRVLEEPELQSIADSVSLPHPLRGVELQSFKDTPLDWFCPIASERIGEFCLASLRFSSGVATLLKLYKFK